MRSRRLFSVLIYICLISVLLLNCGGGAKDPDADSALTDESAVTNALILNYNIRIDNIPLVGPQKEVIGITLTDKMLSVSGTAEIEMQDEKQEIRHSRIFEYDNGSLTTLNYTDSTYSVSFFEKSGDISESARGEENTELSSESTLSVVKSEEIKQIDKFQDCQKLRINNSRKSGNARLVKDSTPILTGEIWISSHYLENETAVNYYHETAKYMSDSNFDGFGVWRVVNRLGVSKDEIETILLNLDGIVVFADLKCEMYSLGKKANVNVSVALTELIEKRIPYSTFSIPTTFKPVYGKEVDR